MYQKFKTGEIDRASYLVYEKAKGYSVWILFLLPLSPSSSHSLTYDVFLSIRSEDRGSKFARKLHRNLVGKGMNTFNHRIQDPEGQAKAIEESTSFIALLSEKYAYSGSCLDELVHILECKKSKQLTGLANFLQVRPLRGRTPDRKFWGSTSKSIWVDFHKRAVRIAKDIMKKWSKPHEIPFSTTELAEFWSKISMHGSYVTTSGGIQGLLENYHPTVTDCKVIYIDAHLENEKL